MMAEQQKSFERLLKAKVEDQRKALDRQRIHFETLLRQTEPQNTVDQTRSSRNQPSPMFQRSSGLRAPIIQIQPSANSTAIAGTNRVTEPRRTTSEEGAAGIEWQLALLAKK